MGKETWGGGMRPETIGRVHWSCSEKTKKEDDAQDFLLSARSVDDISACACGKGAVHYVWLATRVNRS